METLTLHHQINENVPELRGGCAAVDVETNWVSGSSNEYPQEVSGRLVGVAPDLVRRWINSVGLVAVFRSHKVRFGALNEDGNFTLVRQ
jgi:hypothetical protein